MLSALCMYPGLTELQPDCRACKGISSQSATLNTKTWIAQQGERWRIMFLNLQRLECMRDKNSEA